MLEKAASNFLNKNEDYIRNSVGDVLEGNVREIIGQMRLEDIVQDRKMFAEKVQENAAPDMARMGLEIVSFNVQNVTDEGNVIENLGIDRVVSISKSAQISRAESERDIAVAKANATKQANDARIEAETAIAERNNELEKQELKRSADVKKAEADAAYEIQQQEQRKTIEITTANANIAKQEKEIELREKEIAVKEKTLDADIRKQAEAEKYATQQKADAQLYQRQKEAEAKQFEIQKQAEAKKAQAGAGS
jgi:flotillin